MNTARKSSKYRVTLSSPELLLILGALAETLEEKRQPYTGPNCRRLARLHSRLDATLSGSKASPDYAVRADGAVVLARNPYFVVAPAHGLAEMLRQMKGSMAATHE